MSTASLPSYHYEPQPAEQRLAHRGRLNRARPRGQFVKNSRSGGVVLCLSGQKDDATLPEYGRGAIVQGTVHLAKFEGVQSVEVKIEGALRLKEIAEGGTFTSALCLDTKALWTKDSQFNPQNPMPFSLTLPTTFFDGKAEYPLPPTYEVHLSGLPGFRANIDYSVSVIVTRSKVSFFNLTNTNVSTPFVYYPRMRPAMPLPPPLLPTTVLPGAPQADDWKLFDMTVWNRSGRGDNIMCKFYTPASRIFSITERIPFHLYFTSSAKTLATFLPFAPSTSRSSSTPNRTRTRVQLLRQSTVDVRSVTKRTNRHLLPGNQTDIWRTDQIGEGIFTHDGDGPDWMAWSGEIPIDPTVQVGGFKASGLHIKDYILISVVAPEHSKQPFDEVRKVVPIRLTTDPWSGDLSGDHFGNLEYSGSLTPDGNIENQPELPY